MARPGFLNENINRSYPFIKDRVGQIPDCAVADFGSTTLAGSGYVEGEHEIWLEWIRRLGPTIEFSFRSDAPGLSDQALIFQRDISDADYVTSFTHAQPALTEEQLDRACECGTNVVCNPFFDETEAEEQADEDEDQSLSLSLSNSIVEDPCLDKYPGSAVYGWDVTSGVTQASDMLRMEVPALGYEQAVQIIEDFVPGQKVRLFVDLVSMSGTGASSVTFGVSAPTENDVIAQTTATEPGLYEVTIEVPAGGTVWIVIKAFNTSATSTMVAELDNVTLQSCISNSSSYSQGEPDPEVCPVDSPWEGFLVTGDMDCLLEFLEDCTRAAGVPGGEGDADVLFLTDTTGSMGGYISTIKAVFSPLATSITALLPSVTFNWAAASYKDYEDGAPYTAGIKVDSTFNASIAAVQAAINGWSAGGGGDGPEQNLSALKISAEEWLTTFSGRANAQKILIWGGDIYGWEDGAKGNPYPKLNETISALVAAGVKVFGINSQGAGAGIDGDGGSGPQASAICNATGGTLTNSVSQTDADKIAELVATGVVTSIDIPPEVTVSLFEGPAYVEPSRTKNLEGNYVRSFGLANADRTRATTADDCRDYCWPFEIKSHYVRCECVAGAVRFTGGCNADIRVDSALNAVIIDGDLNGGGESCDCTSPAIDPLEAPPIGRTTLDGAPDCNEVIRSFNGIGARFLKILGGQGVNITDVPEQNRVIIDVGLNNLALCPDIDADEPVTCLPPSTDLCECGPTATFECPDGQTTPPPDATTTTTGAPTDCGDPCTWVWTHPLGEDASWQRTVDPCLEDCDCVEPTFDGTIPGETKNTSCFSIYPECRLNNNDFELGTRDSGTGRLTDLPAWSIGDAGAIAYFQTTTPFAYNPILQQGNVVRLSGEDALTTLQQQFSVVEGRQYRVKAYVNTVQGESLWGLVTTDGVTVLTPDSETFEAGEPGDPGRFEIKVYTAPPTGHLRVFFQATNKLTFTGRGLFDVASVCIEEL